MRYITKDEDGTQWSITPMLRFIERPVYDVPVEGNPKIFGGRYVKILQQKQLRLDPHHYEPDGTVRWVDIDMVKEE